MLWSFSRDGGVPGYKLWSSVNKFTGTPINAGEHRYSSKWRKGTLSMVQGLVCVGIEPVRFAHGSRRLEPMHLQHSNLLSEQDATAYTCLWARNVRCKDSMVLCHGSLQLVQSTAARCCGHKANTSEWLPGAVWAMVTLAFILALPLLNSTVAFSAVISISTVGLYISCEPHATKLKEPVYPTNKPIISTGSPWSGSTAACAVCAMHQLEEGRYA